MAFRMEPGRAIAAEARRIADKQLGLAIAGLAAVRVPEDDRRIHTARRHVKKVRALMDLVEPHLDDRGRPSQRRLRRASRMLAAIADGEALVNTLAGLSRRYPDALAAETEAEWRTALQAHEEQVRRTADFRGVLRKAAAQLAAARTQVRAWHIDDAGSDAVARGLRRSVRCGRRAMNRAFARPTTRRYSVWRRRVKELWLQLRLIEGCTGGQLRADQDHLEQLDSVLGEQHNCALLCDALTAGALDSRQATASCLRLVRRYRSDLRREATALAPLAHGTPPRAFVTRIAGVWLAQEPTGTGPPIAARCDHAA